jgi:Protein of unknown function (DUF3716)
MASPKSDDIMVTPESRTLRRTRRIQGGISMADFESGLPKISTQIEPAETPILGPQQPPGTVSTHPFTSIEMNALNDKTFVVSLEERLTTTDYNGSFLPAPSRAHRFSETVAYDPRGHLFLSGVDDEHPMYVQEEGAWVQGNGIPNDPPCSSCQRLPGLPGDYYYECVSFEDEWDGACGCCLAKNSGMDCSCNSKSGLTLVFTTARDGLLTQIAFPRKYIQNAGNSSSDSAATSNYFFFCNTSFPSN